MSESQSPLSRLLPVLVNGIKLLAVGLAALVMAIVAAVSQIFNGKRRWNTTK